MPREFTLEGKWAETVRKYMKLRPQECNLENFFLGYRDGRVVRQPIGKNCIGSVPTEIAKFLNLSSPEEYTGHSFRRSSTSVLANTGVNMETIRTHGGWKTDKAARGYVENSTERKRTIASKIMNEVEAQDEDSCSNTAKKYKHVILD